MESVETYLARKCKTLANYYRTEDGNFSESCGYMACEIAKILIKNGKKPRIDIVRGVDIIEHGWIHSETLVPIQYKGRIAWGAHQVCCVDDIAYDPMLGAPVPLKNYCKTVFGKYHPMTVLVSEEKMEEFLSR